MTWLPIDRFDRSIDSSTPSKFDIAPAKMEVGRLLSNWEGYFSGAMLNFGRVLD